MTTPPAAWIRAPGTAARPSGHPARARRPADGVSTTDWPTLAPDIAAALERGPLGDRRRREVRENGGQTLRYGACGSLRLTLTGPAAWHLA